MCSKWHIASFIVYFTSVRIIKTSLRHRFCKFLFMHWIYLKVHKHEIFFWLFLQKPKAYGPKGLLHEIFKNRIRIGRDIRLLYIFAYAQPAMKSIPRLLSVRWNSFRVCSVCDEICSAYAQHKFTCKNCSHFTAGWAYAKICSSYAQCAMKSFPRMLSVR